MRKPINKNSCVEVGYIKKTHGVKGDLNINLNEDLVSDVTQLEFLFFEIDGLLVPFFIEDVADGGHLNLKFKLIDSKEKAGEYVGCKLFLDRSDINPEADNLNPSVLIGFNLIDKTEGEIGKITEVNDFGGNLVLSVNYQNSEIMIPFNEELVVSFDFDSSTLEMDCPEGILNLDE